MVSSFGIFFSAFTVNSHYQSINSAVCVGKLSSVRLFDAPPKNAHENNIYLHV